MKILVTGFTPFGGETINPSWEAVRALDDSIAAQISSNAKFRPNLKLPLMRSRLQSTHISRMPFSVSDSSAAVHPFRSNASPSICRTPAPPITQASSRTTSRLLTARLTPFFDNSDQADHRSAPRSRDSCCALLLRRDLCMQQPALCCVI